MLTPHVGPPQDKTGLRAKALNLQPNSTFITYVNIFLIEDMRINVNEKFTTYEILVNQLLLAIKRKLFLRNLEKNVELLRSTQEIKKTFYLIKLRENSM